MPYYDFKNELPEGFNPKECPTFDVQVKIDSGWSDAEHKILYVLQHVDSQDLKSGALLSTSPVKETHRAIVDLAKTISKRLGFQA
jgi:hypothetical protein